MSGVGDFYSDVDSVQFVASRRPRRRKRDGSGDAPRDDSASTERQQRRCAICHCDDGDIEVYCACTDGYHEQCVIDQLRHMGGATRCTVCKQSFSVVYSECEPEPAAVVEPHDWRGESAGDGAGGAVVPRLLSAAVIGAAVCAGAHKTAGGTGAAAVCALAVPLGALVLERCFSLPPVAAPVRLLLAAAAAALNVAVPRIVEAALDMHYAHPCNPHTALFAPSGASVYAKVLKFSGEYGEAACAAAWTVWRVLFALALVTSVAPFQCALLGVGSGTAAAAAARRRRQRPAPTGTVCTMRLRRRMY